MKTLPNLTGHYRKPVMVVQFPFLKEDLIKFGEEIKKLCLLSSNNQ